MSAEQDGPGMTPSEPGAPLNAAGGPILDPHAPDCRCWPHVSQSDAFRAVEHAALLEHRSSKPVEREAQGIPLTPWRGPEYAAALAAAPPASGGIPLIDVERLARAMTGIVWVDRGYTIRFTADDAERLAAEYTRLSESSRDHVAPPAETHQQKQLRLRAQEEDEL